MNPINSSKTFHSLASLFSTTEIWNDIGIFMLQIQLSIWAPVKSTRLGPERFRILSVYYVQWSKYKNEKIEVSCPYEFWEKNTNFFEQHCF